MVNRAQFPCDEHLLSLIKLFLGVFERYSTGWVWVTLRLASLDFGFFRTDFRVPLLTLNSNNFRF